MGQKGERTIEMMGVLVGGGWRQLEGCDRLEPSGLGVEVDLLVEAQARGCLEDEHGLLG